jgi:energy-converting hydrogenase Eha subunit G
MIYLVGIGGFVGGFIAGQMILFFLLRYRTNRELLEDKALKLKYGLVNWACAGLGAYGLVQMYRFYFPAY